MEVPDVNGFLQSDCVCFRRDDIFDDPQGAASGTAIKQVIIDWITLNILPLLGTFEKGEPHSIVILDNASIHMDEEIVLFKSSGHTSYTPLHLVPTSIPLRKCLSLTRLG
jgi:hypothetical protein